MNRIGNFEIQSGIMSSRNKDQFQYSRDRSIAVYKTNGEALKLVGTGFVVEFHGRYFLCTAAHLIKDHFCGGIQPCVALDGAIVPLPCIKVVRTSLASDSPTEELDIGAWLLELDSGEYAQYIESIAISSDRLASTDVVDSDAPLKLTGYPVSQNKSAEWQSRNTPMVKGIDLSVSTYANFDYDLSRVVKKIGTHIAIDWDKNDVSGQPVVSPRGLSGAPVFHYKDVGQKAVKYVVGVFIEYHKNENIGVFTRAEILLDLLEYMEYVP